MPPGPLIQLRAPEFSRWTVTYGSASDPHHAKTPSRKRITVTKTTDILYAETTDGNGRQNEKWCFEKLEFISDPVLKRRLAYEIGHDPELEPETDFSKTDFPGFEWISGKNYADTRKFQGQECLIFIQGGASFVPDQDMASLPPAGTGAIAYINLKTRLPMLLQKNGETCTYQFEAPPQTKLTLPADIQETINFHKKHAQELARMPAQPF